MHRILALEEQHINIKLAEKREKDLKRQRQDEMMKQNEEQLKIKKNKEKAEKEKDFAEAKKALSLIMLFFHFINSQIVLCICIFKY